MSRFACSFVFSGYTALDKYSMAMPLRESRIGRSVNDAWDVKCADEAVMDDDSLCSNTVFIAWFSL